jgi:pyruvate,orthophosphate dikinase
MLFIQKVLKDSRDDIDKFIPVLDYGFDRIRSSDQDLFYLFARSYYQLNKVGLAYSEAVTQKSDCSSANHLLISYYRYTYDYWLEQPEPLDWFKEESGSPFENRKSSDIFRQISKEHIMTFREKLEVIVNDFDLNSKVFLDRIIELPGYGQIVDLYSDMPRQLLNAGSDRRLGNQWKLIFLLHIMTIEGLSSIHEKSLRDINRTLAWLIEHEETSQITRSIEKTFHILKKSMEKFPNTALNCILNMGKGVYKTDESDLVEYFIDSAISLGFQSPEIEGVSDDWQMKANSSHVQNIRTWLELIGLNPKWSKKLLSSLIINLSLKGVFIKDTDLFPRDITKLLNSEISTVYNLTKQLARLFPAYFNDIGAEGRLRDISTRIDEINMRKDVLIHFLRKQSHVESSNRIVGLMEAIINFWKTRDKGGLKPFLPEHVYTQIKTEGPYIDNLNMAITHLAESNEIQQIQGLLNLDEKEIKNNAAAIPGLSNQDYEKLELGLELYKLLYQKYNLGFTEMEGYLNQLQLSELPDIEKLKKTLKEKKKKRKLARLLEYLETLKSIILSPKSYGIRENIYRKRHFTVDIPSMYGSYHEVKFDAMGLTFRLESILNTLFEELIETIDLELITRGTFSQIHDFLGLFNRALKLEGISSFEMERQLDLLGHALEIRGFSATQYLDIFRGFSKAVSNIVNDYFNNIHHENLLKALEQLKNGELVSKYLPKEEEHDQEKKAHRITEIFLRDRIASSLGLQQLDHFLGRILNTLHHQSDELPKENLRLLLSYEIKKTVTPIEPIKKDITDIIHLGNKALNLVKIKKYGLPVPQGFIVSTEVFRCREIVDNYLPAKKNLREQVAGHVKKIEKLTGKSFGNPRNPLLLSVRSGAAVSQPGMMATFLDVGINEDIVNGMLSRTGNEWFVWDTYRRFLQSYGMAFDMLRDSFDEIIDVYKKRFGVAFKKDFTGPQMREVALEYKKLIRDNGIEIEANPLEQLFIAIKKVLDSWHAPKAETYRRIMRISDDWGTAVTVQAMVFGNLSSNSGSGVVFSHNPRWTGDMLVLWGDFTLGNQGEDVVSGLVTTLPISKKQSEIENRDSYTSLESMFPEIYLTIREWAKELIYEKKWSPQEMEFTFESPKGKDLYILQTRDMEIRERKKVYSFELGQGAREKLIGHGIGVSGGAMSGRIVFNLDEIHKWREAEPETPLIIIRGDTVPDDIQEIFEADGLLTARGGSTSHAAIVAHRLGKTCVVGCPTLICREEESTCSLDQRALQSGEWISIDGKEGSVYLGQIKIKEVLGE